MARVLVSAPAAAHAHARWAPRDADPRHTDTAPPRRPAAGDLDKPPCLPDPEQGVCLGDEVPCALWACPRDTPPPTQDVDYDDLFCRQMAERFVLSPRRAYVVGSGSLDNERIVRIHPLSTIVLRVPSTRRGGPSDSGCRPNTSSDYGAAASGSGAVGCGIG